MLPPRQHHLHTRPHGEHFPINLHRNRRLRQPAKHPRRTLIRQLDPARTPHRGLQRSVKILYPQTRLGPPRFNRMLARRQPHGRRIAHRPRLPIYQRRARPRDAHSTRRLHHRLCALLLDPTHCRRSRRQQRQVRRQDRLLEVKRHPRKRPRRHVHQLKQFRARLLFRRIDVLIPLDDINVDRQL